MSLSKAQVLRIASLELNAFNLAPVMPELLEGARVRSTGTPILDISGEVLFYRIAIHRGSRATGYADIGAQEVLGEPLLSVTNGAVWNERKLLTEAVAAARKKRRSFKYDKARFVAYSYPKLAVQFLRRGEEVLMLELWSWIEVPQAPKATRKPMMPSNFERWSLIKELPTKIRAAKIRRFRKRLQRWDRHEFRRFRGARIRREPFLRYVVRGSVPPKVFESRELHYSPRNVDHHICYELRGQQTNVWCVAASTEMLLNFYRYTYDQPRLATELVLGTCNHPNGLPYANVGRVVTVIEDLTSDALDATMHTNPGWALFRDEINGNRPLISFIPGHSRTVTGYIRWFIAPRGQTPFRGLLVYDPWPPTTCAVPDAGGTITKWENFATQTYQYAYSAVLQQV